MNILIFRHRLIARIHVVVACLASGLVAGVAAEPTAKPVAPVLEPGLPIPPFDGANVRAYAVTTKGDYAKEDFQAEVTVTLKSGASGYGIAFFGLGEGRPDPAYFQAPHASSFFYFSCCPDDFGGGQLTALVDSKPSADAHLGNGTHRLRLTWDATRKRAWLQVHKDWKTDASFTPALTLFLPDMALDFSSRPSHLFVGGAAGVAFADFAIKTPTAGEIGQLPKFDLLAKDASGGTWLPVAGASAMPAGDAKSAGMDVFLRDLGARLRPMVCWYEGARLHASRPLPDGHLELPYSQWDLATKSATVAGEPDARDLTLSLTLREGAASSAGLAAAFDFADWSTGNYVMIPASVYNGNRQRIVGGGYANGLPRTDLYRQDLPLSVLDLPHLALEPDKPSKLEVSACNTAAPCICVYVPKAGRGFIILAEQAGRDRGGNFLRKANQPKGWEQAQGEILDNAFAIEESADRRNATLVVGAPGVRERKPEFVGFSPSSDRGLALNAGDAVTLKLRVYAFRADGIPAVLEKFMAVRKALTGSNHPHDLYPMSEIERRMVRMTDGRFQTGKHDFYGSINAPGLNTGWVGGLINTFPMLATGDEFHLKRVTQTFDFACAFAFGKAGYCHGQIEPDGSHREYEAYREHPELALVRRSSDVLYWMVKQFDLLKAQGRGDAIKPEWEAAVRKLADAFVATWKREGQWGNYVNTDTGAVAVYNSTSAAQAPGGLALAARYFHNPEYLKVAREAADYYYRRDFVQLGMTTGHSADTLQNADGDSPSAFMTSLMVLYEITGDRQWLEKSRNLANLFASWTTAYDYELPKWTELGQTGCSFSGMIWASTQNKHGAPGSCTSACEALLKIYRATGDVRYAGLLRDIFHAWQEGVRGSQITERLGYCDTELRGSRGDGSTPWCELNGLLMAMELPGIYARTDKDETYVFDSIQAQVIKRDRNGVMVKITNPTQHDAKVTVLAEDGAHAAKPLGCTSFIKWPKVEVKAGATVEAWVQACTSSGN